MEDLKEGEIWMSVNSKTVLNLSGSIFDPTL